MARLLPLRGDLEPEARELAEFLREAFERLGIHVRDYAKATNWSPGTLSKFLSGDRIPRQDFIDRLLADAYPQHSSEEAEAARRRGRDLRSQALRVRNSREAEVDRLEQALSDAKHEILLAEERERALSEALLTKRSESNRLQKSYQEVESYQSASQRTRLQLESSQRQLERITKERERAQKDIDRLVKELHSEREHRKVVEKRRDELEVALSAANVQLVKSGASVVEPESYKPNGQLLLRLGEHRTRWGGWLNIAVLTGIICVWPLYLGSVYRILPKHPGFTQLTTILSLIIPGLFALRVRNIRNFESRDFVRNIVQVAIFIAVLFLVGFLI